jgi:hypothetical protein
VRYFKTEAVLMIAIPAVILVIALAVAIFYPVFGQ